MFNFINVYLCICRYFTHFCSNWPGEILGKSKYFSVFWNWCILQISAGSLDAEHLFLSIFVCLEINFTNLRGVLGCGALVHPIFLPFFAISSNFSRPYRAKKSKFRKLPHDVLRKVYQEPVYQKLGSFSTNIYDED